MYIIKYGDAYIHDPRTDDSIAVDCTLTCEQNSCGYCEFTVYPTNPIYSVIALNDYSNLVTVYEDSTIIFQGFIYEIEKDFNCGKTCNCKGDLALLSTVVSEPYATYNTNEDVYVVQTHKPYNWEGGAWKESYKISSSGYYVQLDTVETSAPTWISDMYYTYVYEAGFELYDTVQYPSDPAEYLQWMLALYNSRIYTSELKIQLGTVSTSFKKTLRFQKPEWTTIWDDLSTYLVGDNGIGGYLRIRYEDGVRYLDYLYDWDETEGSQIIDFGVNLTDYTLTESGEEFANCIYPYGASMSSTSYALSTDPLRVDFVTQAKLLCLENTGYEATADDPWYGYYPTLDGPNYDDSFESNKSYYRVDYVQKEDPSDSSSDWECLACGATGDGPTGDNPIVTATGTGTYVCNSCQSTKIKKPGYKYAIEMVIFGSSAEPSDWGNNYYDRDVYMTTDECYLNLAAIQDGYYSKVGRRVSDGTATNFHKVGHALRNESSIKKYGEIQAVYEDTDAADYTTLLTDAIAKLDNMTSEKNKTIEVSGVDLHLINPDISPIRVGEYVRIRSKPHDIDAYYICTSIDLDLNTGENSTYTFNGTYSSYTKSQLSTVTRLNQKIKSGVTKVEKKSTETGVRPASSIDITKTDDLVTGVKLTYTDGTTKTYTFKRDDDGNITQYGMIPITWDITTTTTDDTTTT